MTTSSPAAPRPEIRRALLYGWRRRCPRCGEGALFRSWFTLHERCSSCDLVFEESPGDTWGFWILGDRVFIAALLLVIVLGFRSTTWWIAGLLFLATTVPFVWTMPHRLGVCVALDFLARAFLGEAAAGASGNQGRAKSISS